MSGIVGARCTEDAMRTLLLLRHGQATHHIEHRVGGSYDDDLTALGREQAARLAARVAAEYKLDRLFASTLKRAAQTAEAVAVAVAAACGVRPTFDDRLREMASGAAAGLKRDEAARRFPTPPGGWKLYSSIPAGESPLDVFRRVAEFYLQLRDRGAAEFPEGTVAVVAHGGTLRDLVRLVMGRPCTFSARCTRSGRAAQKVGALAAYPSDHFLGDLCAAVRSVP
jgi:2,3-bisphosphoglycerate-dependent phosphoglycerate mutase